MGLTERRKQERFERLTDIAWMLIVVFWALFYCAFVIFVWPGVN